MSQKPVPAGQNYLPARMVNEFVYCPRLFYYEYVEGLFADNTETVEGRLRHTRCDDRQDALPPSESLSETETIHARSVTLSSDRYGVIATIDLVEASGPIATPVDYKRGAPRVLDGQLLAWEPDRVQLAVQALVLRDNGYQCNEGVIFYWKTRQRVRVAIDEALVRAALDAVREARRTAESGQIPPPLVDSPKCPRCSLVGICLPDETTSFGQHAARLAAADSPPGQIPTAVPAVNLPELDNVRKLLPARDDRKPLYITTQGLYVGKSGEVLKIKDGETVLQEIRINDICQVNIFGNIQVTTQAIQTLCQKDIPIAYFSQGGWFYGMTCGLGLKNVFLRKAQFRWVESEEFCLSFARALVAGKIRNQRTMLQRNHIEPPQHAIALLKALVDEAEQATAMDQLLGIEGNAARIYFENFSGMIKVGHSDAAEGDIVQDKPPSGGWSGNSLTFDFVHRNRRPPRDPVNALLSLGYSLLTKDMTAVCHTVGFDPFMGYFHQLRFGRPSLALDLMEPFRPLIVDSAVLTAINTRMVTERDFVRTGQAVALTPSGRKGFFRAYEQRMDDLVTHPLFGYRVSYRRVLEIQTRLLARVLTGELSVYPVFTTR
ncbi:MAG: CRISPR-associated exonuclease Cas4/endonuclease Cas1 fusion [Pirellulaceae bacterium]|nr:MAG: CRISPR-associated exonuclease Cas4/endonuclease Cas1 fusion [Pirellulaceae bacterium]